MVRDTGGAKNKSFLDSSQKHGTPIYSCFHNVDYNKINNTMDNNPIWLRRQIDRNVQDQDDIRRKIEQAEIDFENVKLMPDGDDKTKSYSRIKSSKCRLNGKWKELHESWKELTVSYPRFIIIPSIAK